MLILDTDITDNRRPQELMEKRKEVNVIIVDDEKGCVENLRYYLSRLCPEVRILACGSDLKEVIENTGTQRIDLAFLDVELFDDNIFSILADMEQPDFRIVFVTAHEDYALKAIKVEALDYMLKPLAEDDILECYAKIKKHFHLDGGADNADNSIAPEDKKRAKIILKSADKIYVIKPEDICYMTGRGFYSDITFMFNKEVRTVIVSKPLNKAETEYEHPSFFRVHKSYIINTEKIKDIIRNSSGVSVKMADDMVIPIAKRREQEFLSFLNVAG